MVHVPFRTRALSREAVTDALRTNVMLADANLVITYLNPALRDLLQDAEADLRRELPNFTASKLVGCNIDVFHKNPAHQRRLLDALRQPHSATINIGARAFDLVVTPIRQGSRLTGYVVEWADAHARLQNVDFAAQIAAIGRSQAVIQFRPDGTVLDANENFLTTMKYALTDIVGRHHSMFVEPGYRASAAYQTFWDELRKGRYQADEFHRIAKDGRSVFVQGSYNPILDQHGKVVKIVKFMTDVTARVEAVGQVGRSLGDLAEGVLDRTIQADFPPEIEPIRLDFNRAAETLRDTVRTVQEASRTMASGLDEISVAASDLSQRTEQQAASLEETVAALADVARGVNATATAAGDAHTTATAALKSAEQGGAIMAKAVEAMGQIERSSDQIKRIIGVIDEIAFQTNLLALNAGVEAARAGEAGRGFAVVAQEVRGLAQRSAEAAREIKDLISNSSAQVGQGVELVSASGRSLEEIVTAVGQMSRVVGEIADSSREQALSLKEVATAADQMDKVTQQNAAMVEETTAAAQNLQTVTRELTGMMDGFRTGQREGTAKPAKRAAPRQTPAAPVAQMRTGGRGGAAPKPAQVANDWEEF